MGRCSKSRIYQIDALTPDYISTHGSTTLVELHLRDEIGRIERIRVGRSERGDVLFGRRQVQILIAVVREPLDVVEALWRVSVLRCLAAHLLSVYVVDVENARFVHFTVRFDARYAIHEKSDEIKANDFGELALGEFTLDMINLRLVIGQQNRLERLHNTLEVVLVARGPRLTLTVSRERNVVYGRLKRAVLEAVDLRARHLDVLVAVRQPSVDLVLAHLERVQIRRLEPYLKRISISCDYVSCCSQKCADQVDQKQHY